MKATCIVLTIIILLAITVVCIMVKFATEITVDERKRELMDEDIVYQYTKTKTMGVIPLNDDSIVERFPYVAAVTTNSSTLWSFACFASVILIKWVVTSAHCRRPNATHRVLLFHDFAHNYTHTYPILSWRLHENFDINDPTPRYDIAVAKLNVDYPITMKPSIFDERKAVKLEASIWKILSSTMNKKLFLTNNLDKYEVRIADPGKCFKAYGVEIDNSMICIDVSEHEDCFIHEFGPLYAGDKVVGVLAMMPKVCELKLAIFTNVSYYTNWILNSTRTILL